MITKYCRPSDIVTGAATITLPAGTVSTDASYGLDALRDGNPAKPCKFTTAYATLLFDFGAPRRLDAIAVPHHNLDAGLNVRFQANTTDAWGSPALDVGVVIGAHEADGHVQRAWVDLTTVIGYTTGGYRYWRLHVPASNSVAVQIGEVVLVGLLRQLQRGFHNDVTVATRRSYIPAMETEAGVELFYERDVAQIAIEGEIVGTPGDYAETVALLADAHGPSRPFFFVLDASIQHADGLFVRATPEMASAFSAQRPMEFRDDVVLLPWSLKEVSRGLPL